jgi:SAM-dependent methyltransferase
MQSAEYHKRARVEDDMWYFRALHAHARALITNYRPDANGLLLDAGSGTGGFIRRAAPWFPRLRFVGIDLFQIACDLAREKGTPRIARASTTSLPFRDASMSVVTSLDVLQHIPDHEAAAAEIARVLEPGGLAVINAPAYMWLWSYHDDVTDTERRYTRPGVARLLSAAGLEVLRSTYWNFLPLPIVVAKRKLLARFAGADDVKLYPPWAERVLGAGMALERGWIGAVGRLPAGSSVLVAARKRAHAS